MSFLVETHPEVAEELISIGGHKDVSTVYTYSNKKASWRGRCGHEWEAPVSDRSRRGDGCPYCSGHRVLAGFNDLATREPRLAAEWSSKNRQRAEDVTANHGRKVWWVCDAGHEWEATPNQRTNRRSGCPYCSGRSPIHGKTSLITSTDPPQISRGEEELFQYIYSRDSSARQRDRTVLEGKELDIYLPNQRIAIEYNGLWWHREASVGREYHQNKYEKCRKAGIRLVQIWEDDWRDRREVVESMIDHLLGVSTLPRLNARDCAKGLTDTDSARTFMYLHHIQGFTGGSYQIALTDETNLVAVMTVKVMGHEARIERYATAAVVRGGFTRLLKEARRILPEHVQKITTFSDKSISDGQLYEKSGFKIEKILPPDYSYVKNNRRTHKFNLRKERVMSSKTLLYEEGLTEQELAKLNGLYRVWDAGKIKWTLDVRNQKNLL